MSQVQGVPRAGGHRPAPPQRQLLRRAPPAAVPPPGREGDRRPRHAAAGGARARRRQRRQGLAGRVGPARRARLRGRRPVHRARHRRVQRRQRPLRPGLRRRPRPAAAHDRPARRARLRRADGGAGDPAGAVLGVRAVQAAPVRLGRPRRRLRRRRHRPQPRRRGRRAARQHAALGHRLPGPPAAGAARRRRLPAQGQAARAADRAGDGGVVHRARHRLPGRGVPDGGRQQHLGYKATLNELEAASPGTKAAFYLGFLERMAPLLAGHSRAAVEGLGAVRHVRLADDGRGVRVLPPGRGRRPPTSRCRSRCSAAVADDERAAAAGRAGAAARRQAPALPRRAHRGRRVPQPRRLRAPRRRRRPAGGRRRALDAGRGVHGAAPDARGLRRSRCRAAPRSSTPRTWRRSACSPTSARARGCSSPASARARCR